MNHIARNLGRPWVTELTERVVPGYGLKCAEAQEGEPVASLFRQLWSDERGQDIAEYAVMLAVILVIVVGTIRLIGTNANSVFSQVGSSIQ
jgi:pilus assembly protein Flp/PilA